MFGNRQPWPIPCSGNDEIVLTVSDPIAFEESREIPKVRDHLERRRIVGKMLFNLIFNLHTRYEIVDWISMLQSL